MFGESFGPTAATVWSVRSTLRRSGRVRRRYPVRRRTAGEEPDVEADQDADRKHAATTIASFVRTRRRYTALRTAVRGF